MNKITEKKQPDIGIEGTVFVRINGKTVKSKSGENGGLRKAKGPGWSMKRTGDWGWR